MMMRMAGGMDMPRSWLAQPCPYARLGHAIAPVRLGWLGAVADSIPVFNTQAVTVAEVAVPEAQKFLAYSPRSPPQLSL